MDFWFSRTILMPSGGGSLSFWCFALADAPFPFFLKTTRYAFQFLNLSYKLQYFCGRVDKFRFSVGRFSAYSEETAVSRLLLAVVLFNIWEIFFLFFWKFCTGKYPCCQVDIQIFALWITQIKMRLECIVVKGNLLGRCTGFPKIVDITVAWACTWWA